MSRQLLRELFELKMVSENLLTIAMVNNDIKMFYRKLHACLVHYGKRLTSFSSINGPNPTSVTYFQTHQISRVSVSIQLYLEMD